MAKALAGQPCLGALCKTLQQPLDLLGRGRTRTGPDQAARPFGPILRVWRSRLRFRPPIQPSLHLGRARRPRSNPRPLHRASTPTILPTWNPNPKTGCARYWPQWTWHRAHSVGRFLDIQPASHERERGQCPRRHPRWPFESEENRSSLGQTDFHSFRAGLGGLMFQVKRPQFQRQDFRTNQFTMGRYRRLHGL